MKVKARGLRWLLGTALVGFCLLLSGAVLNPDKNYLLAVLLVMGAVALYFLQVFTIADRNWLDFRAVFSGVWLGTIGLAALRFAEYQKVWQSKTWFLLALAYLMLEVGVTLGLKLAPAICDKVVSGAKKLRVGKLYLKMHPNRLFGICMVTTLIGLCCFSINIAIKGFVPAFSDIFNAYTVFYTKFHVFSVAAVAAAPLCYYCIATQPLSIVKKIILGLCIFYLVFAFPILAVSRGVFIVAALGLAVSVYYIHGKRLWILILCIAMIGAGYLFASELRNYTDEQMTIFFQPAQITLPGVIEPTSSATVAEATEVTGVPEGTTEATGVPEETTEVTVVPEGTTETTGVPEGTGEGETGIEGSTPDGPVQTPVRTFSLPPKLAFLYSYITVSHDNFNEAVMHVTDHTMGARQMAPFNVILRSQKIQEKASTVPFHQVTPLLNTINLIGDFFYDFGAWGVGVCMLLWSVVFGVLQGVYDKSKNIFVMFILGNTMVPVAMSFFSPFMSNFTHWMIWGVALLMAVAAYLSFIPQENKKR